MNFNDTVQQPGAFRCRDHLVREGSLVLASNPVLVPSDACRLATTLLTLVTRRLRYDWKTAQVLQLHHLDCAPASSSAFVLILLAYLPLGPIGLSLLPSALLVSVPALYAVAFIA